MKNALIIVAVAALLGLGAWYYTTMNPAPAYNPAGTQETGTETPTDTPTGDTQTTFTMAHKSRNTILTRAVTQRYAVRCMT